MMPLSLNKNDLLHIILHGNKIFDNMNMHILTATINFINVSERFDKPLF